MKPGFTAEEASRFAQLLYGFQGEARALASYQDQNFLISAGAGERRVLKIANSDESPGVLEFQNAALRHLEKLGRSGVPRLFPTRSGEGMTAVEGGHLVRMLSWLDGEPLADVALDPDLARDLGRFLASLDEDLRKLARPGRMRELPWDVARAEWVLMKLDLFVDQRKRALVERAMKGFEQTVPSMREYLRWGMIHGDANDHNVLVGAGGKTISGLIDFGDLMFTNTVCEPAIAMAYAMLDRDDTFSVAEALLGGYHAVCPLSDLELDVLYELIRARLCISVTMSAANRADDPDNGYLVVSEKPAWRLLERLDGVSSAWVRDRFESATGGNAPRKRAPNEILELRQRHLGGSLSVAYDTPLEIVRGRGAHLFDQAGREYLDCVNNVCHVGHCHPAVVAAGARQMAELNTNTRYLHDNIVDYAQRLCAKFPDPLSVCFFVCSGSEANDLASRMARTRTGARDVIVLDGAYHGTTQSIVELSPYKYGGPGGFEPPAHVHELPTPDPYRNPGGCELGHVDRAIAEINASGGKLCAFIAESILGCAGQIVLPEGYLRGAYERVRAAGGVCIADEVQVGFGRVGTHFWAFETQGVVPDIVTLGKPIGNGHPMAAVVTTPEIAAAFDNGMEYFNTFGGNPVSCTIGLAVLDVIEREGLQAHAADVGAYLKRGLEALRESNPLIGDVRGLGLFLGIEFVHDRTTKAPAPDEAQRLVEQAKERGVLLSTDGPHHNVIKIKPPLVINHADADLLLESLR